MSPKKSQMSKDVAAQKEVTFKPVPDAEGTCGICLEATPLVDLIQVPRTFQRPSGKMNYHLGCYLRWAVAQWTLYMKDIRHMQSNTVFGYAQIVQRVLDTRIAEGDTNLFAPTLANVKLWNIRSKNDPTKKPIAPISFIKRVGPAWAGPSGFVTWCSNAPLVPECFYNDPAGKDYFSDLLPYWKTWLTKQTKLTVGCANNYGRKVGFYVMKPGPISMLGISTQNLEDAPEWTGCYGFWTWFETLKMMQGYQADLAKQVCADSKIKEIYVPLLSTEFPAEFEDLVPGVPEDPVLVGDPVTPRTIELTDSKKSNPQKNSAENDQDEFDLTPVLEESEMDMTKMPELGGGDSSGFEPDIVSDDGLMSMIRKEVITWEALCQKFPDFTTLLLEKGLITMADVLERAESSVEDSPAVFMFRYLDRLCRAVK